MTMMMIMAWYARRQETRWFHTDSFWRPCLWHGTCQFFASRLTLTLIWPCRVLAVWRRWRLLAKRRNTSLCRASTRYDFQPIAVETLGPINVSATAFLYDLGRRISLVPVRGENRTF